MKSLKFILCFLALSFFVSVHSQETPYKKITPKFDPEAQCLDGTPASLYLNEGKEKDKFFIFLSGGGICAGLEPNQTIEECYKRSKTFRGSSSFLNEEQFYPGGYLSTNPQKNKFGSWNQLLFPYCDGSLFQGYKKQPVIFNNTKIYFRGASIIRSHLNWLLKNYNFADASQVVITGSSAGGIAALLWANYVQTLLNDPTVLSVVADSGSLLYYPAYKIGISTGSITVQNLFSIVNAEEKTPNTLCNSRFVGEEWKCFSVENSFCSIAPRTLLLDSQYDEFAISQIMRITCVVNGTVGGTMANCSKSQINYIEGYRSHFNNLIKKFLQFRKNSAWTISCIKHTGAYLDEYYNSQDYKVEEKTGKTMKEAVEEFVFDNKRVEQIDVVGWPNNVACAS